MQVHNFVDLWLQGTDKTQATLCYDSFYSVKKGQDK